MLLLLQVMRVRFGEGFTRRQHPASAGHAFPPGIDRPSESGRLFERQERASASFASGTCSWSRRSGSSRLSIEYQIRVVTSCSWSTASGQIEITKPVCTLLAAGDRPTNNTRAREGGGCPLWRLCGCQKSIHDRTASDVEVFVHAAIHATYGNLQQAARQYSVKGKPRGVSGVRSLRQQKVNITAGRMSTLFC